MQVPIKIRCVRKTFSEQRVDCCRPVKEQECCVDTSVGELEAKELRECKGSGRCRGGPCGWEIYCYKQSSKLIEQITVCVHVCVCVRVHEYMCLWRRRNRDRGKGKRFLSDREGIYKHREEEKESSEEFK